MMIRSITVAVFVPVISVVAGPAQDWTCSSQDWTQNLYANVDLGGVYQQADTTLYQSTGMALHTTFNLGIRGDMALGYNVNQSWAVEFETGVLWNSMNKVGGVSLSSIGQSFDTYTVPFLAKVIYKVPLKGPFYPYVGIGAGGAATIASFDTGGFTPTTLGDYDFVFACQAETGLEYKLTKSMSVDVAYKFFATSNPRWYFSEIPDRITEDGFFTHAVVFSFAWNF